MQVLLLSCQENSVTIQWLIMVLSMAQRFSSSVKFCRCRGLTVVVVVVVVCSWCIIVTLIVGCDSRVSRDNNNSSGHIHVHARSCNPTTA